MTTPAFELTMQDPPRMNERLDDLSDLAGETILATFDTHETKGDQVVIVTDCFNWLVLDAEADGCGEDPFVRVRSSVSYGKPQTLADFVPAKALFDKGCINAEVYRVLQAEEDARKQAEKDRRASGLRAELAKLEGAA